MNRPNPDNYDEVLSIEDYVSDLEKYCDQLEKAFKINTHRYKVLLDRSRKMRHELEQALDKACELMGDNIIVSHDRQTMFLNSKEGWKERLMKDE